MDNNGNFTQVYMCKACCLTYYCTLFWQVLCPKSYDFFCSTNITTFGTEALFIPNNCLPINKANLSNDVFDLDTISSMKCPVLLGSIFGGIESSEAVGFPPEFHPEKTQASSRLIDVYLEMPSNMH